MLRAQLQQITDTEDLLRHRPMLETLRQEIPHSIKMLSGPNENLRYNCVMYALGIEEDREYIDLVFACPEKVHGNTAFVQYLIQNGDLDEQKHPASGLLAIYFNESVVRHISRLISESRVVSKWGCGHLYEHDILDAPSSYGDVIRYFKTAERDQVVRRFIEFAKSQGVRFNASED